MLNAILHYNNDMRILLHSGIPDKITPYLKLTHHELSHEDEELLPLGTKFHYKKKFKSFVKKVVTEVLFESTLRIAEQNLIENHETLKPQILAESTRNRDYSYSPVVTRTLTEVAKERKEHENIFIGKADMYKAQ